MRQLTDAGERLWGQLDYEDYLPLEGLTAMGKHYELGDENQFSLDGGIPAWTVEGDDLAKVNDFLKKSCMEFCGSLPGDEKGEDGYSLSGEAKEAALSYFALPENRKAALDVIRKLNESRDSNENAL
jgi:hypothetical protein